MRRSEKIKEIKARNQLLIAAHSARSAKVAPTPSVRPEVKKPSPEIKPMAPHNFIGTAAEINPRVTPRQQGFSDHKCFAEPEYYNSSQYFHNNFTGISNSALVASFGILLANLFNGATHSSSSVSATLASVMKSETLLEAGATEAATHDCPKDIRTLYRLFDLDPQCTTYACCPLATCCSIYPLPSEVNTTAAEGYPLRCTHAKFGIPCDEPLMQGFRSVGKNSVPKPIKPFYYHHFHDHVASMLARPGIEDAIQSHMKSGLLDKELTDIISSPALQGFVDHTGRRFIRTHGDEIRLVWALSADWYNPRGNKASGKVVSTGAIAMVCLSLPPSLRTLEENVYLCGLIPGPQEPSVDATNHFLVPLVNDLNVSYKRGVHYSRTHRYPSGRTSRSAVIPVIADTMASKKITGNCSHSATYFCSRCRLHRDCIGNLDPASWPPALTRQEHEMVAQKWHDAGSKTSQKSIFSEYGIRWSPLLLLPYWQPAAWTITEAIHVVLLGLIPRHCRDLLGLNFKDLPSDDLDDDPPSPAQLEKGKKILESGMPGKLQSLNLNTLRFLCLEQGIRLPSPKKGRRTKREYISALLGSDGTTPPKDTEDLGLNILFDGLSVNDTLTRNSSQPVPTPSLTYSNPITKEMLSQIRDDIGSTHRPNWQAHLPDNFGCPEHGKLKADQWRTALEFDIPISLIRIKSLRKPSGNIEADARLQKLVDHTLDLAMSIAWGLSRRTSPHHAERYMFYMKRYLAGIKELFPDYNLKPNHHYALHIPDLLLAFGPLHGTWAFVLERLIGLLQKLNSNFKTGDMENTAMSLFCRRQGFIHLMGSDRCPPVLRKAWAAIEKDLNFHDLDTGLHRPHILEATSKALQGHSKPITLDSDIQHELSTFLLPLLSDHSPPLNTKTGFAVQNYAVEGVTYCSFDKSPNHSLIYFRKRGSSTQESSENIVPAQIRLIFQHCRVVGKALVNEVFAAVHQYQPVQLTNDPFATYPDFRAKIYHKEPISKVTVIQASQIYCHANQRPWNLSSIVMRAVNRKY